MAKDFKANSGNNGDSNTPKKESKPFIDPKAVYDVDKAIALLAVNKREVNYAKRKFANKYMTINEWQTAMKADDMMFTPFNAK